MDALRRDLDATEHEDRFGFQTALALDHIEPTECSLWGSSWPTSHQANLYFTNELNVRVQR